MKHIRPARTICLSLLLSISLTSLSAQTARKQLSQKLKAVIFLYDGVYLLDFCGPLEVLNDVSLADSVPGFEILLVSPSGKPVTTHTGTHVQVDYSLSDCPSTDVLVIPGGEPGIASGNNEIADWIRKTSLASKYTVSVCTGAFILAETGLLDGKEATTWHGATNSLQKKFPKIKVCTGKRVTHSGSIITTAGVSAGIDGSLFLIREIYGHDTARKTAEYIEYNYHE